MNSICRKAVDAQVPLAILHDDRVFERRTHGEVGEDSKSHCLDHLPILLKLHRLQPRLQHLHERLRLHAVKAGIALNNGLLV